MENVIHPRYLDLFNEKQISGVKKSKIIPIEKGYTIHIQESFKYNDCEYHLSLSLPSDVYEGARTSQHTLCYSPKVISEEDATQIWIESLIFEKSQEIFYRRILSELYNIKIKEGFSKDEYLELIVAYVQSIPYDDERSKNFKPGIKYPIETAVEGRGICSDKSLLLAGLLSCSGYAVSILFFDKEKHMMVGIPIEDGSGTLNSGYAFIETTTPSVIGVHPETKNGSSYYSGKPEYIYRIGHGNLHYDSGSIIPYLHNIMKKLELELNQEKSFSSHDSAGIFRHNKLVGLYNKIVSGNINLSGIQKELENLSIYIN